MKDQGNELLSEGYFVRLTKSAYTTLIGTPPPVYRARKFVFLYLESEESLPNSVYTFGPIDPGEYVGPVEIEWLYTEKTDIMHQFLFGCKTMCRTYLEKPLGTKYLVLERRLWDPETAPETSYFDESKSPFHEPNQQTELFVFKGVSVGFFEYNPTEIPLTPQMNFIGKRFKFSVVTEPDMIDRLERRVIPYRPITLEVIE